nr:hypothetical protein HK105_000119 [Polyrhizophydium stewartii]
MLSHHVSHDEVVMAAAAAAAAAAENAVRAVSLQATDIPESREYNTDMDTTDGDQLDLSASIAVDLAATASQKHSGEDTDSGNAERTERRTKLENAITEHLMTGKFFIVERTIYVYSKARFGFSRRTTNTYLCSSYVYESITEDKTLPVPINISHVRSLHKYTPQVRRHIWRQLCDSGLSITEENVVAMTIKYETGVSFTDLNNELYTPRFIIAAAKGVAGVDAFDVDPASCPFANELHPGKIARQYFTEASNGLVQPWRGHVWLSPPGGLDEAGSSRQKAWFFAAERKYLAGEIQSCQLLLRVDAACDWFARTLLYPHCFFGSRLSFMTPMAKEKTLTDSHMVVYMGSNPHGFCQHFGKHGSIPGYNTWSLGGAIPGSLAHVQAGAALATPTGSVLGSSISPQNSPALPGMPAHPLGLDHQVIMPQILGTEMPGAGGTVQMQAIHMFAQAASQPLQDPLQALRRRDAAGDIGLDRGQAEQAGRPAEVAGIPKVGDAEIDAVQAALQACGGLRAADDAAVEVGPAATQSQPSCTATQALIQQIADSLDGAHDGEAAQDSTARSKPKPSKIVTKLRLESQKPETAAPVSAASVPDQLACAQSAQESQQKLQFFQDNTSPALCNVALHLNGSPSSQYMQHNQSRSSTSPQILSYPYFEYHDVTSLVPGTPFVNMRHDQIRQTMAFQNTIEMNNAAAAAAAAAAVAAAVSGSNGSASTPAISLASNLCSIADPNGTQFNLAHIQLAHHQTSILNHVIGNRS